MDTAWKLGTRYFDTAPFYGAGLSEIRLGRVLAKHKRNDYMLSTKVGRLILDEVETKPSDFGEKTGLFEFGRANKIVYDYSADGTKRSIDDSLKRLGVDRIDFVWVHDIAQDFHGDAMAGAVRDGSHGRVPCADTDARTGHHQGLGPRRQPSLHLVTGHSRPMIWILNLLL